MIDVNPTYLRNIYNGLNSGAIHKSNTSFLPTGLIGLYEDLFPLKNSVHKQGEIINLFGVCALLKTGVSVDFISSVFPHIPYKNITEFISTYSKWFCITSDNKYYLYHERLKVYIVQKICLNDISRLNDFIIQAITYSTNSEMIDYKYRFQVYHLLIKNDNSEYKILTDLNTFINARTQTSEISYFENQFEIVFKKYAKFGDIRKLKSLQKSYSFYIQQSFEDILANVNKLYENEYFNYALAQLKTLPVNQRSKIWFSILAKLVFDENIDVQKTNNILLKFDELEDDIISTYNNSNENVFCFSDYDVEGKGYPGESRVGIYKILNRLIDQGLSIDWLLNRFFWYPSYAEAKDGFIQDPQYHLDFRYVKPENRQLIITKLIELNNINKGLESFDFYRTKTFLQNYLNGLYDVKDFVSEANFTNSQNDSEMHNSAFTNFQKTKYTPRFYTELVWQKHSANLDLINQLIDKLDIPLADDLLNLIEVDGCDSDSKVIDLFTEILTDHCSATYDDGFWIEDEYESSLSELLQYLFYKISETRFCELFQFITENISIGFWNYGIGQVGQMNSSHFKDYIIEQILPFLKLSNLSSNKIKLLLSLNYISKCDLLRCEIDTGNIVNKSKLTELKLSLQEVIDNWINEPIILFHILNRLNISLRLVFKKCFLGRSMSFHVLLHFLANRIEGNRLGAVLLSRLDDGLSEMEKSHLMQYIIDIYQYLASSNYLTDNLQLKLLSYIISSPYPVDIKRLYRSTKNKPLFLFIIRPNAKFVSLIN